MAKGYDFSCECSWLHIDVYPGHRCSNCGRVFEPIESKSDPVAKLQCSDGLNTLPTIEDIRKLELHNQTLNAAMQTARVNGLIWDKALMLAVKCLVEANNKQQAELIKYAQKYGTPVTI